jgi:hypothetical protein
VASGESGEEAAWRDLIANYAAEPAPDDGEMPWPERENLTPPRPRGPRADAGPDTDPAMMLELSDDTDPSLDLGDDLAEEPGTGDRPGGAPGTDLFGRGVPATGPTGDSPPGDSPPGDNPPGDSPPGNGTISTGTAGNGSAGSSTAGRRPADRGEPGPDGEADSDARPGPGWTASQPRVIRPASPDPPRADDDEDFVPPVPPPLPSLDPIAKGAWTALFAGPGYLLIATMAGWLIPAWAAFLAVAAFVGGFATLVIRMGDKPPRDSGPDDGAVL